MKRTSLLKLILLLAFLGFQGAFFQGALLGQTPAKEGDQFMVNLYTIANQQDAALASDASGNFVVVWQSLGSYGDDNDLWSVQAQRYASDGGLLGTEFQVNTYTTNGQEYPDVAVDPLGGFVVVWHSRGSNGTDAEQTSIQGQRFASDGAPIAAEFQVNTYTSGYQRRARVAMNEAGDFVVVWESTADDSDSSGESIQGQRFASDGSALGSQFLVNTYTTSDQDRPAVAMRNNGDFIVSWFSSESDTDNSQSVQAQRFGSDGSSQGGQFQANTTTTGSQYGGEVAVALGGQFIITWTSFANEDGDNDLSSVQGQAYASDGSPVGTQFLVNRLTSGRQTNPDITAVAGDDFVVTWESENVGNGDASGRSIQGQLFNSSGNPLGRQFLVNTYTDSSQSRSAVTGMAGGEFVVTWGSIYATNDTYNSVQGQRFVPPLFADGFESGDVSAWSATN